MKKIEKKFLTMLCTVAEKQEGVIEGWPPECLFLAYQPKRPTSKKSTENK